MNVNEVLHVFEALLLDTQLRPYLAIDAIRADKVLAGYYLALLASPILCTDVYLIRHSFQAHVLRLIEYRRRINSVVQLLR